jgi:hypothetical protein
MKKKVKAVAVINDLGIARNLSGRYGVSPRITYAIYRSALEAEQAMELPLSERIADCVIIYDDGVPSKKVSNKVPSKRKKK